ncbi:MAG: hypothetical protein U1F83_11290 [Verrucomicrobiota bacterium]
MKPVDQLTPSDLTAHRVWEFVMDMEDELPDETYVRPVDQFPVNSLANRVVSAHLTLANGQKVFGVLGNLDLSDPKSTLHFLDVSIFDSSEQLFHLARYHDVDYASHGPMALAGFLRLPVEEVFPIHFDISDVAVGRPDCIRGNIFREPLNQLSKAELIDMAIESTCRPQD